MIRGRYADVREYIVDCVKGPIFLLEVVVLVPLLVLSTIGFLFIIGDFVAVLFTDPTSSEMGGLGVVFGFIILLFGAAPIVLLLVLIQAVRRWFDMPRRCDDPDHSRRWMAALPFFVIFIAVFAWFLSAW